VRSARACGDSLTAGYVLGRETHPPAHTMQRLADAAFGPGACVFEVCAVSGSPLCPRTVLELGTPPCIPELIERHLASASASYDLTLLLGGTNDLGGLYESEDALEAILAGHAAMVAAAQRGLRAQPPAAHTLVLTLPDAAPPLPPRYLALRSALNAHLLASAAAGSFMALDLLPAIPYAQGGGDLWSDELHFSPAGYERVGSLVFERVKECLARLVAAAAQQGQQGVAGGQAAGGGGGAAAAPKD
jgi:lysophospholipase L1-like esterase